ncbi:MAG: hypothetical protein F4Z85_20555 [Gemmatimonadetes bacterium]|nr:hypothetical protein [Gemmatimonadota bacterium]MYB71207.1 hypothetical protein [Gemmatimonadota bacterium]
MQSLTFVFEATLLAPLVEFATSTSGHVEPRQGLALGWLGSVVAGLAVMFGTAERAQAGPCNTGWHCSNSMCAFDHHGNGLAAWDEYYVHDDSVGGNHCTSTIRNCSCPP